MSQDVYNQVREEMEPELAKARQSSGTRWGPTVSQVLSKIRKTSDIRYHKQCGTIYKIVVTIDF